MIDVDVNWLIELDWLVDRWYIINCFLYCVCACIFDWLIDKCLIYYSEHKKNIYIYLYIGDLVQFSRYLVINVAHKQEFVIIKLYQINFLLIYYIL